MIEKAHILGVLEQAREAVKKEDIVKLKELSNQTIHSASINQDSTSILIAIIIYSLGKIIERTQYKELPGWNSFFKSFIHKISKATSNLEKDDEKSFEKELNSITKEISSLTGDLKTNIKDVFQKASINKASKIYEHGISLEKTSKLLGISIWELQEYAGQSQVSEVKLNKTIPIRERIKLAEEFFK